MAGNPIEVLLVEALRGIVDYVEAHDASATDDDDVRALEDVGYVLNQVAAQDRERLKALLGPKMSFEVGLSEELPDG